MKILKMILVLAMLLITACSVTAIYGRDIELGSFRTSVYGDEIEMHYNVHNTGAEDIDSARVTLWIPDIGYYAMLNSFDLSEGEHHGLLYYDTRDSVEPGTYLARLKVSSDYAKDSKWIWLRLE